MVLEPFLEGSPVGAVVSPSATAFRHIYFDDEISPPETLDQLTVMPFAMEESGSSSSSIVKIGLNFMPIPEKGIRSGPPIGIVIFPLIWGKAATDIKLSDGISIKLSGAFSKIPVLAEIRPAGVSFNVPQNFVDTLNSEIRIDAQSGDVAWILIGSSSGFRIELSQAHFFLKSRWRYF